MGDGHRPLSIQATSYVIVAVAVAVSCLRSLLRLERQAYRLMCSWGLEQLILHLRVGAALTSGFLGVGACVACVASVSSRVIVRKLEREQKTLLSSQLSRLTRAETRATQASACVTAK